MTPAPRLFPDFVTCVAARLGANDHRLHRAAGRDCAARAIRALTAEASALPVGRGPDGEPLWPAGLTGSITHTGDFVAAAVARTTLVRSLGIDAERIAGADRASRIASLVARPEELSVPDPSIADATWITLLFSIKEAVFKCLYPIVRTRFYYQAVEVTRLERSAGTFEATLRVGLPGFAEGLALEGQFAVDSKRVYAGVYLACTR